MFGFYHSSYALYMNKTITTIITGVLFTTICFGQMSSSKEINMTSEYLSENKDISDLMFFQGIEFYKLKFEGVHLKGATFKLTAKEIWDGKIGKETIVTNSAEIDIPGFEQIQDTVFAMKIISELTPDNDLKMSFNFPRYGRDMKFKATKSEDYSLRNIPESTGDPIVMNEAFYLFAYILPYEKDGAKYWCAVEGSGKEIEQWGKEFGIKHYLLFEMTFESPKNTEDVEEMKTK